jgi:hypothetical protein
MGEMDLCDSDRLRHVFDQHASSTALYDEVITHFASIHEHVP